MDPRTSGPTTQTRHDPDGEYPDVTPGQAITPDLSADERDHLRYMQASCAFFAVTTLTGPPEKPYHGRFMVADHHDEWDDLVIQHERLCVLAPRDHGKSYFFNFAFPIWKAVHMPGGTGMIFSATQPQAEQILDKIKTEIESNPKLQHLIPAKKNQWSTRSIKLSNGHRIYARGFGTKVRGAHPNWIVVDDGLNDESMYSETVRKKQIDYFFSAITNMLVPGGQLIIVGTPFHAADLYAVLEENPEYTFRRYSAVRSDGKPLWPGRYDADRLAAKQREIGGIRFAREFECKPVSDAMSLFPSHLFEGDPTEQLAVKLGLPLEFWKRLGIVPYMGVDFALSSSVQADYFVVWVMGKDRHGNRWIIDVYREKGLPYHRQLSVINTMARRYEPGLIFLEANQMQRIFGDELIRKTDLPIKKFTTSAQEKNSLEKGVPGLRTLLENHKVRIPRGDKRSVEAMDVWKSEMQAFTWVDGKLQGLGAHDDTVMAFWICDQAIKQGGFEFTFGDEADLTLEEGDDPDLLKQLTGVDDQELRAGMDPLDDREDEPVELDRETQAVLDEIVAQSARKAEKAAHKPTAPAPPPRKAPPKRGPIKRTPVGAAPPAPSRTVNLVDHDYEEPDDPFQDPGVAVP